MFDNPWGMTDEELVRTFRAGVKQLALAGRKKLKFGSSKYSERMTLAVEVHAMHGVILNRLRSRKQETEKAQPKPGSAYNLPELAKARRKS